ncbi:MAG: gliding motility-associated C-terminal domain-containing protein, partial [Flavobacteriales bacterium]|nr:gliding motility-associated C-terminal domain-containing protein [Flavobacteriales bacterium]
TSTDMCVAGNSFAGLSDTLYVIFQNPGNTFGHFKNTNNGSTITSWPSGTQSFRTFILSVPSEACSDSVTYNLSQMVNQFGSYGGDYVQNDGSTLVVGWPGAPTVTYVNHGCQAPFTPLIADITTDPIAVPCGSTVELAAVVTGNVVSVHWSGGAGTFSNVVTNNTAYTLAASEIGGAVLSFCAVGLCGDTVCDQVQIPVLASPQPSILSMPSSVGCGETASLSATVNGWATSVFWQGGSGTWSDPLGEVTDYTPGFAESGVIALTFCAVGSCSDTVCTAVPLNVEGAPTASIVADGPTTICAGSSVTLTASGGNTYAWSTGADGASIDASVAGTYTVTATNACGAGMAEITIEVDQPPVAQVNGPLTSCSGEVITLLASGGTSYAWSTGGTGETVQVDQPGTYSVVVSAECGADQAEIIVQPGISWEPSFTVDVEEGCSPLCVQFTAQELGEATFAWDFGDGSAGDGPNVGHCYAPGDHSVTLTATSIGYATECPGTITVADLIHAWPLPSAAIGASPATTTIEQPTIQFMDLGTGANAWQWTFGDVGDSSSTEPSPAFTYDSVACYIATLEVTNAYGCFDSARFEVCVEDPYSLWVPNAFTPNGDGYNDTFFPGTTVRSPHDFQFMIFDRWGQQLFVSSSPDQGWDGANATSGVYVWKLWIRDTLGKQHESIGHVTLVR